MVHRGGGSEPYWLKMISDDFEMKKTFSRILVNHMVCGEGEGGSEPHWLKMIGDVVLTPPPLCQNHIAHTHTHIQTDGDYTQCVVETLRDHTLKKVPLHLSEQNALSFLFEFPTTR